MHQHYRFIRGIPSRVPLIGTRGLRLALACTLFAGSVAAAPVGTAFTYQGELRAGGTAPTAAFDFEFALFSVPTAGSAIDTEVRNDAPVNAGLFTVELDFTDVPFAASQEYFLEVRVREGASTGGYTQLLPRQRVTPAPYAINARTVQAGGVDQAAIAAGAVGGMQLQDGAVATAKLANLAVNAAKLADGAVGASKLADASVGFAKLADAAVAGTKLADAGVTEAKLATGSVVTDKLADGAVVDAKIANTTITGAKLANATITDAKIADGTISAGKLAFAPGDITEVVAGAGLSGGASAGSASLAVNFAALQARITGTCPMGEYFRGVAADGSVACEPVPGVPRITTVEDQALDVGTYTDIAIGADGLPVISYHSAGAGSLKVAKCANSACSGTVTITTVDDPANTVGTFTSIAIGNDGLPIISYRDTTAAALKVAKCANAACTGSATITTVEDVASAVGQYTSIAIGADGVPVIAYYDATGSDLRVAKCANAACTGAATITAVDTASAGAYASIAVGLDGFPAISYHSFADDALKVAKCINAACTGAATINTLDNPANTAGLDTSIAIGTDGAPVISYRDSPDNHLKVAKCLNAACTGGALVNTLDAQDDSVGPYSSIAIGRDGLPVISYQNFSGGSLMVAHCIDTDCVLPADRTTLDRPANVVGAFTSIAIGVDGLPVVSYYDGIADALKVAKCGTRSCQ